VWHDFGNLNISFILPRSAYDPERFLDVVLAGLRSLHIPASRCERRSLWLGERKVAGSAFMLTGQSAMVHVCLLVDADLDRLRRALKAPGRDLRGRFIHSVPAHVRNLADAQPGLTVDALEVVLGQTCCRLLDAREGRQERLPQDEALLAKYRSWDWNYGRTADFEHHLGNAVLHVRHGRIAEAEPAELDEGLRDLAYDRDALAPVLAEAWHSLLRQIPPSTMVNQGAI
jgi:lipoate-protein ligase A